MDAREPYFILDEAGVRRHLAGIPQLADRLGGPPDNWRLREVSDGNLNTVFLVDGSRGGLCVKQSLPHVRVDVSWKLPLDRAFFEAAYMRATAPFVPGAAPALLHYDPDLFCLVMEQLTPHVVLRHALMRKQVLPGMAGDVGRYVARTSFHTSGLARRFEAIMDDIALFAKNQTLTRITVDLVLTDPYRRSARNRWTRPFLDDIAAGFRDDATLKAVVARMGQKFLSCPQALLHGDLHSGSVMVTETDTRIIDGEFAWFGPIGFDLGLFVANLLLNAFTQTGPYREWAVTQIGVFWREFREEFMTLWRRNQPGGDILPALLQGDDEMLFREQEIFISGIFDDMLKFAGMEIIRRILGYAHVLDLESIADGRSRAVAERAALDFARSLLTEGEKFGSIDALTHLARQATAARATQEGT